MNAPAKDDGYAYPSAEAEQHIGVSTQYANEDTRRTARGKLLAWGEPEVAIILGLLPDDGRVI